MDLEWFWKHCINLLQWQCNSPKWCKQVVFSKLVFGRKNYLGKTKQAEMKKLWIDSHEKFKSSRKISSRWFLERISYFWILFSYYTYFPLLLLMKYLLLLQLSTRNLEGASHWGQRSSHLLILSFIFSALGTEPMAFALSHIPSPLLFLFWYRILLNH